MNAPLHSWPPTWLYPYLFFSTTHHQPASKSNCYGLETTSKPYIIHNTRLAGCLYFSDYAPKDTGYLIQIFFTSFNTKIYNVQSRVLKTFLWNSFHLYILSCKVLWGRCTFMCFRTCAVPLLIYLKYCNKQISSTLNSDGEMQVHINMQLWLKTPSWSYQALDLL